MRSLSQTKLQQSGIGIRSRPCRLLLLWRIGSDQQVRRYTGDEYGTVRSETVQ